MTGKSRPAAARGASRGGCEPGGVQTGRRSPRSRGANGGGPAGAPVPGGRAFLFCCEFDGALWAEVNGDASISTGAGEGGLPGAGAGDPAVVAGAADDRGGHTPQRPRAGGL